MGVEKIARVGGKMDVEGLDDGIEDGWGQKFVSHAHVHVHVHNSCDFLANKCDSRSTCAEFA